MDSGSEMSTFSHDQFVFDFDVDVPADLELFEVTFGEFSDSDIVLTFLVDFRQGSSWFIRSQFSKSMAFRFRP